MRMSGGSSLSSCRQGSRRRRKSTLESSSPSTTFTITELEASTRLRCEVTFSVRATDQTRAPVKKSAREKNPLRYLCESVVGKSTPVSVHWSALYGSRVRHGADHVVLGHGNGDALKSLATEGTVPLVFRGLVESSKRGLAVVALVHCARNTSGTPSELEPHEEEDHQLQRTENDSKIGNELDTPKTKISFHNIRQDCEDYRREETHDEANERQQEVLLG
eukprot:CAMPEP_0194511520 /NCGR_PEP_ID=MMETSP0253-20130528/43231_1 /TAXON_ID=2966 /ORGANISM="Noctiluca scintillans" /LENGTH=219 /DNA_ID=CAMNT_0039354859 /DNA_START=46 /DNA_END=700 /DNA_ORIENTATION=-